MNVCFVFVKTRHQEGDMEPLSIDEILDETNQLDITARQKHWLATEVSLCVYVSMQWPQRSHTVQL